MTKEETIFVEVNYRRMQAIRDLICDLDKEYNKLWAEICSKNDYKLIYWELQEKEKK